MLQIKAWAFFSFKKTVAFILRKTANRKINYIFINSK